METEAWFNGPACLKAMSGHVDQSPYELLPVDPEVRNVMVNAASVDNNEAVSQQILKKFWLLNKLIIGVAPVVQWQQRRGRKEARPKNMKLSLQEITEARKMLMIESQGSQFSKELDSMNPEYRQPR